MNPNSENNPIDQTSVPPDPQDTTPVPPANPGGVIKPENFEDSSGPNPSSSVPSPSNPVQSTLPPVNSPQPEQNASVSSPDHNIFPPDPNIGGPSGRSLNKRLILIIVIAVLIVLSIAGFVFGYYIPNKPENAYKTGLDRSGDALQMIIDQATEHGTYDKFKKSEVTATMEINYSGQQIKGDFSAKFDDTKLDTELNANFPTGDSQQADLGFNLLSEKSESKDFPDTYLKIKGVKALGADLFLPGIGKYDDKWLAVSADYLQSIADEYGIKGGKQQDNTDKYPTFEEISALIRDEYAATNEYVLTSDPSKAVLVNKQYLGKEKVEGVNSFHYEVGVNKENYKAYCEAVSNILLDSAVSKKFMGLSDEAVAEEKQSVGEDCQKDSEAIKDEDTFEMWVDSKYKLIKKVRTYSSEDKGEYFEVGQNYDGGDDIGFFFVSNSDKGGFNSKATFTTNLNTGESSGELTFTGGEDPDKYDGKLTLNAKPLSSDFQITKPSDTISIKKLLKEFGINPKDLVSFYGGNPAVDAASGANAKSNDALVKSNVNSIYSQLEVFYAEYAYYPTQSQLNDPSWRATNMQGLSDDAFSADIEYSPTDCNATGCQKFTLSGKLQGEYSSGSSFVKESLNN